MLKVSTPDPKKLRFPYNYYFENAMVENNKILHGGFLTTNKSTCKVS